MFLKTTFPLSTARKLSITCLGYAGNSIWYSVVNLDLLLTGFDLGILGSDLFWPCKKEECVLPWRESDTESFVPNNLRKLVPDLTRISDFVLAFLERNTSALEPASTSQVPHFSHWLQFIDLMLIVGYYISTQILCCAKRIFFSLSWLYPTDNYYVCSCMKTVGVFDKWLGGRSFLKW